MTTQTRIALLAALVAPALALAAPAAEGGKWTKLALEGKDLFATLKTNQGDIQVHFFSKDAPKTVANFVGLATGEKEYTDPRTGKKGKGLFYDGVIFHRVIPNFMIQGGDRSGTGAGSIGYTFEDEFQSGRKFDKVGLLAMANSGPATNSSQFFITTSMPAYLNGKHTIFGEVTGGYDVVEKISNVARNRSDRPDTEVVIEKVEVSEKAPKAGKKADKK